MKSVTFYRLLLGLPYLFLIPGYYAFKDSLNPLTTEISTGSHQNSLASLFASFGITGIFWLIPYTLFIIWLLIWSRGKSRKTIKTWFASSPFLLMILSPVFFLIIILFRSLITNEEISGALALYGGIGYVFSAPYSLIFGFIFVGIGLTLDFILSSMGILKDEPPGN